MNDNIIVGAMLKVLLILKLSYAIAGLGAGEIVLILIVGFFLLAFFGGIIFLIYSLINRKGSKYDKVFSLNMDIPLNVPTLANDNQQSDVQKEPATRGATNEKIALP